MTDHSVSETEAATIRALADRFIGAIQAGDIETVKDCYDPDAFIWLNTARVGVDRATNVGVLTGFVAKTSQRLYEERRVQIFAGGYVQQHVLKATHLKGPVLVLPATLVCQVHDGRIVRLEEYFDSAPLQTWYGQIAAAV